MKGDEQTSEFELIRQSMKWLRKDHGRLSAATFGPRTFKAIRQGMIGRNLSRHTINTYMS